MNRRFLAKFAEEIWAISALMWIGLASAHAASWHTLHTGTPDVTSKLMRLEALPATQHIQLSIGLPLRETNALTNLIGQLYDRKNTNFHRYLTPEQFAERFSPAAEDYEKIKSFARSNHLEITTTYGNRLLIDVNGAVPDIENAFHVHMGVYQHPTEHRKFFAPDVEPTVDSSLNITYIMGLDNYELPHPQLRHPAERKDGASGPAGYGNGLGSGSGTNGHYQGSDFRNAYVPGVSLKGAGQVIGLFELDTYYPGNVTKYESLAGLPNITPQLVTLPNAPTNPGTGNNECCADIDMVISMAPSAKVLVVVGNTGVDVMNEFVSPPSGVPLALQISSSWYYSRATNTVPQMMQMAAQGQTFFLCSGDSGAFPNGTDTNQESYNYLTLVGGSELYMTGNGNAYSNETVWNFQYASGASSGLVATQLAIPPYQLSVNPTANGGSSTHRNVPDVAMCADYCVVVDSLTFTNGNPNINLNVTGLGGTSLAAPLWAAFTALVNEQAVSQGLASVGFLNPALYDIAQGPLYTSCFHDVISGNNINSNSAGLYTAGPGYDNCTGLGTPNGVNMINALVNYTGPVFVNFNYTGSTQDGAYNTPYKTLAGGTSVVSSGGTIIIETAGSTSETPTITNAMTITASDGNATIGN